MAKTFMAEKKCSIPLKKCETFMAEKKCSIPLKKCVSMVIRHRPLVDCNAHHELICSCLSLKS